MVKIGEPLTLVCTLKKREIGEYDKIFWNKEVCAEILTISYAYIFMFIYVCVNGPIYV